MKILLGLLILSSCSQNMIRNARITDVSKESEQLFKEESFIFSHGEPHSCHRGQIEKGLELLKNEYYARKNEASYWNELGVCYYLKGEWHQAKTYFHLSNKRARAHHYAPAMNNLALIYFRSAQYPQAEESYLKSIELSQSSVVPRFNLAQLYLQQGRLTQAYPLIRELLKMDKENIEIQACYANYLAMRGNYKLAINYFERLPGSFKKRSDIALNYALTLFQLGKNAQAKEVVNSAEDSQNKEVKQYRYALQAMIGE